MVTYACRCCGHEQKLAADKKGAGGKVGARRQLQLFCTMAGRGRRGTSIPLDQVRFNGPTIFELQPERESVLILWEDARACWTAKRPRSGQRRLNFPAKSRRGVRVPRRQVENFDPGTDSPPRLHRFLRWPTARH
jgi:hypothetical protein